MTIDISGVLTEAWIGRLVWRWEARVQRRDLFGDTRKRDAQVKALVEEGLVTQREGELYATAKAYEAYPAKAPAFTSESILARAGDDARQLEAVHGIPLHHLSIAERAWVCKTHADYVFILADFDAKPRVVDPFSHEYTPAERRYTLYVAPADFLEKRAARVRELDFGAAFGRNLGWGLATLGVIDEVEAPAFKGYKGDGFPFGSADPTFSTDPAKWPAEAETIIFKLRERIARDTQQANTILRAIDAIDKRGGWDAVLAEYRGVLVKRLEGKPGSD